MKESNYTPTVKAKITWMNEDQTAPRKATASITIANSFKVHGLSVVEGTNGLFISMPQRQVEQDGNKKYIDIAHPVSANMSNAIRDAILGAYSQTLAMSQQYKTGFQKSQKSSESVPSEGNATSETEPVEIDSAPEGTETESEDESSVPIMCPM